MLFLFDEPFVDRSMPPQCAMVPTFFFNLALFYQDFTFIPLGVKIPSLDPELGTMTYGAKVTCLSAIGYGRQGRRSCMLGVAGNMALTWPEVGATIYGAMICGTMNRGTNL